MKIIILLIRMSGGVGSVIREIKPLLEKKGHSVKIISREDDLKCFSTTKSFFNIRDKIKKINYDILYTQDWSCALPLIFYKNHFTCFHGKNPGWLGKIFQRIIGRIKGKKLIVVGDKLKREFPRANLIYNGVDVNRFKPKSRCKRIKNSVGFANWTTDIYNFNKIKKAVERIGKILIIAEGIPKEKMPEFFNKIEMFISLPPDYAGFNLVWMEAMASGVPKIIGNRYGVGPKLPITKIEEFKNIEDALMESKKADYRKWLLENKNFNWEKHTEKIIDLFKGSLK